MGNLAAIVTALSGTETEDDKLFSQELRALLDNGMHQLDLPFAPGTPQEAFQQVFTMMGGLPRLLIFADRNPHAFYKLYARMLSASTPPQEPPPPAEIPAWFQNVTPKQIDSPRSSTADPDPMTSDSLDDHHA